MAANEQQRFRELFEERDQYLKTFEERRKAFDLKVADQITRRKDFERSLSDEISESREALAEVAPLAKEEIADAPMSRAAYTDRMSAVMSKLSLLAYIAFEDDTRRPVLENALGAAGLKLTAFWSVGDTQAYLAEADHFLAVAFRGTTDRGDRKTDFRIGVSRAQVAGHEADVTVHEGFYEAFRLVEPGVRAALHLGQSQKPIYITGHSLGGALALVASAALAGADSLGGRIAAVYTYGAPRVGGAGFSRVVKAPHYRVVIEGDVVPLVPPSWISGYRHSGDLFLLRRHRARPVHSRPWFSTIFLALGGLLSWPFSKDLLFSKRHAISLYASRLEVIARERGRWSKIDARAGADVASYDWDHARALIGLVLILLICWAVSENRKRFPFGLALGALAVQAGLVLLFFAVPGARGTLAAINGAVDGLASATDQGAQFVFGYLGGGAPPYTPASGAPAPFLFAFRVLPLILVISALSALLWHWRILKWITRGFGFLFEKTMGLGGASALAVAANIFMGMVETPIVVRAYLDKLSRAELFLMMVVGLATVAGSTMVAYALILAPVLPNAAGHVLVASVISAPAGVLLARIIIPEAREGAAYDYGSELRYESSMDAIMKGVENGLMVLFNVAATLIVFVAFVGIANNLLALAPPWNGAPITLQRLFGAAFAPVAYMIGAPWGEADAAGGLLGAKLFLTEFIAFIDLAAIPEAAMSERTRMIMTYALCGFANVASVGIMTGGMSTLMPARRSEILGLAWKSLLPGFLATLMTAAIVAAMPAQVFTR